MLVHIALTDEKQKLGGRVGYSNWYYGGAALKLEQMMASRLA